jgi:hypothetical protein
MRGRASWLAALALCGCGDSVPSTPSPPADPFEAGATFALVHPGRAFAVTRVADTTVALVAREFQNDVLVVKLDAGAWTELGATSVPSGPRGVCAVGGTAWVASTSASSLTRLSFDGSVASVDATVPLTRAPTAITCADLDGDGAIEGIATSGQGDAATLVVVDGGSVPAIGFEQPSASASFVRAADVDDDGDADVVIVATALATSTVLRNEDGVLEAGPSTSLACDSPRAAEVLRAVTGSPRLAVACDGQVLLVTDPLSDAPAVEAIAGDPMLYDLAAGDFVEGGGDELATVSIGSHELELRLDGDATEWRRHPVARGPIAVAAFDVEADGDPDLVVLSLEQARLSLFEHRP